MRQKERKSMDRPRRLHPVGTTRSPQEGLRHPGGRGPTIEPCSKKKAERISYPLSGWTGRVGEGQSLILKFLKPAFLIPKSRAEKKGGGSSPFPVLL
ncbi:unnamed protein product [Lupinus luteus]|uniref:Uncharacterized protein n=1 Tax=Lupinus luteus TaxID=3873 RepID=A0AAV1YJA3_LUPLU